MPTYSSPVLYILLIYTLRYSPKPIALSVAVKTLNQKICVCGSLAGSNLNQTPTAGVDNFVLR